MTEGAMMSQATTQLRGVNLGSWLVLEKWMVPSMFEGLSATDETTFSAELGPEDATERLKLHWERWITREDFRWIAEHGLNAVRIPFGHWIFGEDYPYHATYGSTRYPFARGGIEVLDRAMKWAKEFELNVVLDLHAAAGCQNGFDNGGIKDVCEWHTQAEYLDHTLLVLERIASRYGTHPSLYAIEVLNEPRWDVPTEYLKRFYTLAYDRIRKHAHSRVAVMFHDGFRSYQHFGDFFRHGGFSNVIFDTHRYQCFAQEDRDLDIFGHLKKTMGEWLEDVTNAERDLGVPVVCGEWSLGLVTQVVSLWDSGPFNHALDHLDKLGESLALRAYGATQLLAFEQLSGGWFYWNYKTETTPDWCFRAAVEEKGWLPNSFTS